jgi:hypothetical protein
MIQNGMARSLQQFTLGCVALLSATGLFAADYEKTIYNFPSPTQESSNLVADALGNLYGAAIIPDDNGFKNVIYELSPGARGAWKPRLLYEGFAGVRAQPSVVNVFGNLFGTTFNPGGPPNCGIVFELSPSHQGEWKETTLHQFQCNEGIAELSQLITDPDGNLYGTAAVGSIVYRMSSTGKQWNYSVISSCAGIGCGPVIGGFDNSGNLYGANGGVYQLTPMPDGTWTYTVLYTFNPATDGSVPVALAVEGNGELYGANNQFGPQNSGTIFRLSPTQQGGWDFSVILVFPGITSPQGADPVGLVAVNDDLLVGTVLAGGSDGLGAVFALTRHGNGPWKEHVLHSFSGSPDDGQDPGALIQMPRGNLFGTAMGGPNTCQALSCGIAFEVGSN